MIRIWATLVELKNGIITLKYEHNKLFNTCLLREYYSNQNFNKSTFISVKLINILNSGLFKTGQHVELGIKETKLIVLMTVVYMIPLLNLFLLASVFHIYFYNNLTVFFGGLMGGVIGIGIARIFSCYLEQHKYFYPIILSIEIPLAKFSN